MDDFERELTRMMRDSRQPAPFGPGHRARLYQGIRVRRRSRVLWRAGGSALAMAGLSVGLALLPGTGSRSLPADRPPLPATSPTPPPRSPGPTSAPSPSLPPTGTAGTTYPGTTYPGTTAPEYDGTPTFPPSDTPDASMPATTAPPPPVSTEPPVAPPSTEPDRSPSMTAGG
ncbi:cellulase [Streptomyces marokkonensis]|uniref:Cellulase n=1 Tax=Streptomyces marokkonensis TaxID=324855 RepID=A0ABW6QH45_9ACTN